jgi:hypothetical protein
VQSWPACERNIALYSQYPGPEGPTPYTLTTMRGVPAAVFDDGDRIEVYTGDATVVVFADDPAVAQAAVDSLRVKPPRAARTSSPDFRIQTRVPWKERSPAEPIHHLLSSGNGGRNGWVRWLKPKAAG